MNTSSYFRSVRRAIYLLTLLAVSIGAQAQFWKQTEQLLKEEEAFRVSATIDESGQLNVDWSIADDYYMYRDQFKVESITQGIEVGALVYPKGQIEDDPEFGQVEVYFYNAMLKAGLSQTTPSNVDELELILKGQGCNKPVGVCYPPLVRNITITGLENLNNESTAQTEQRVTNQAATTAPQEKLASGYISLLVSAFLAGILLSFTPCVLPMIPILAGVIAGQKNISKARSGWLAICYVLGTVVTYMIAGALAGATGAQLQAYFQSPWVISFICLLLIALAASLFGAFKIELPSSLQSKLSGPASDSKSAAWSSFALGLISALVVGACVSPILILALGTAISQGDPVLGASIMGMMAFGMGLLLIAFGFGAGWLLPRTGAWMTQIQVLFGLMVLGVAVYLLGGLAAVPVLFLWSALLFVSGFYLFQLPQSDTGPLLASTLKSAALACLLWGSLSLLGASQGGRDILQPLESISFSAGGSGKAETKVPFNVVTTLSEVEALMAQAKNAGQRVLIDFYADWCLDCKRMDRGTFVQASVQSALADWQLIKIDVTDTSSISEEVKRHFTVFGPPATLFLNSQGQELVDLRQYGYIEEADFLKLLSQVN